MSSSSKYGSLDGQESVSDLSLENSPGTEKRPSDTQDSMKRAAAKQLIQQYYYQLTEGCGDDACSNQNCASSPSFRLANVSNEKLAVEAVLLSKNKSLLCDRRPCKVSRIPDESTDDEGPSTSISSGTLIGEGAKSKVTTPTSSFSVTKFLDVNRASNNSSRSTSKEVVYLTEEKLNTLIEQCESTNVWSQLIRMIGSVFNNPKSIISSFRKDSPSLSESSSAPQNACSVELQSAASGHVSKNGSVLSVDLPSLRRSYQRLMGIPDLPFQGALINALVALSHTVEIELKYEAVLDREPDYLNVFIIVLENPMLQSPEFLDSAFPSVCRAIGTLPVSGQAKLARLWSEHCTDHILDMVHALQQLITVKIINNEEKWSSNFLISDDTDISSATRVLKILYYASMMAGVVDSKELIQEEKEMNEAESLREHMQGAFGLEKESSIPREDPLGKELGISVLDCRKPLIPYDEFINEPLNDNLDIGADYTNHRHESDSKFSFVPYCFILTTSSKHTSMYYDNRIRMLQERRTAFMQTLVQGGPPNPFLRVRVRRDHIIDDALVNLEMIAMENPSDLRKQLFVEFDGEQGLDEGGVSKEFFQLIVEELFNPDIGMFTYIQESLHFWFNPMSFENDAQFTLIGILLGLAIYNSCILDIHFPMVVYHKLLGKKGTFADLFDVDPTLAKSLQDVLNYEGDDLEDVFGMNYRIGYKDVFGNSLTYDLKEEGEEISVTQSNKQEFVELYADYLLNKSIERQFGAFKRGFLMVTSESPLKLLFRPEEIELLVCGSKELNFHALEEATEYDGGFTSSSHTIQNFWTVVHDMSEEDKKRLLQFTTGTDRVPVGGLSKLKMVIARNGPDSERLPTSHTCFNVLLLPEYPTIEKMRDRLTKAITYSKGFGML